MKTDFPSAVGYARRMQNWTLDDIAEKLDVSIHTVRSWLKPEAVSRREPPDWAGPSLTALAFRQPVTVRRGAVKVTYEPATSPGGRS